MAHYKFFRSPLVGHGLQVGGPWPTGWWAMAYRLVGHGPQVGKPCCKAFCCHWDWVFSGVLESSWIVVNLFIIELLITLNLQKPRLRQNIVLINVGGCGTWAIFYVSGHKSQILANLENLAWITIISPSTTYKKSVRFKFKKWLKIWCEKKLFWLIGPTCVRSSIHRCGTFEPPLRILSYSGAVPLILPKTEISTYCRISCCNAIKTMQRFATKECT